MLRILQNSPPPSVSSFYRFRYTIEALIKHIQPTAHPFPSDYGTYSTRGQAATRTSSQCPSRSTNTLSAPPLHLRFCRWRRCPDRPTCQRRRRASHDTQIIRGRSQRCWRGHKMAHRRPRLCRQMLENDYCLSAHWRASECGPVGKMFRCKALSGSICT